MDGVGMVVVWVVAWCGLCSSGMGGQSGVQCLCICAGAWSDSGVGCVRVVVMWV